MRLCACAQQLRSGVLQPVNLARQAGLGLRLRERADPAQRRGHRLLQLQSTLDLLLLLL